MGVQVFASPVPDPRHVWLAMEVVASTLAPLVFNDFSVGNLSPKSVGRSCEVRYGKHTRDDGRARIADGRKQPQDLPYDHG